MDNIFGSILPIVCVVGVGIIVLMAASIKIVTEYERGVVFRLGRVQGPKGPGLFFIIPIIDRMIKVDLRTVTLDVPSQEAITSDNVTVSVNAVAYFHVLDPVAAIINIEDYTRATWQIAQTTLRNVIGQSEMDQLLQEREQLNERLQAIIDLSTEPWGVKVTLVEVKDVELSSNMVRAMAKQAEAERERRAKIIHAEGEMEASTQLANAAKTMAEEPGAMTLRYLQTLLQIGVEQNTTIIFPIPVDLFGAFQKTLEGEDTDK
jgi:regulator of protease activity HflC (stomatin/prohibitin superfamily)